MNEHGGSYVVKEDQSGIELVNRGGTEALVNGRAEDDVTRAAAEAAATEATATTATADTAAPVTRRRVLAPAVDVKPAGDASGN